MRAGAAAHEKDVRAVAALALLILAIGGGPGPPDEPPVFLTVRQANPRALPVDAPSASVSADGRYVAFVSYARLAAADTDSASDIYVLDRATGNVSLETFAGEQRVSLRPRDGTSPHISGDGRFLVYEATEMDEDRIPLSAVAVRDRRKGTTELVRVRGQTPNGGCATPVISADGRIVVFSSSATNLVDGPDLNGSAEDVYALEMRTGTIRRVSVDGHGRQSALGASYAPAASDDGRYVAFVSTAALESPAPAKSLTRPQSNVYLRDTSLGVTTRISVGSGGAAPDGNSYQPSISGDGRYVAFTSEATNLASHDSNRASDVFLYDVRTRTTTLISRTRSGDSANGRSMHPAISGDGRGIAFQSDASDLTCGRGCVSANDDMNLVADVFLFDRESQTVRCISRGRAAWLEPSLGPAIDGGGAVVAFSSRHPVDARDVDDDFDLFVRVLPTLREAQGRASRGAAERE